MQVTVELIVTKDMCTKENKFLLVELLPANGTAVDPYMDNNWIVAELPPMECDDTGLYSLALSGFSFFVSHQSMTHRVFVLWCLPQGSVRCIGRMNDIQSMDDT